MQKTLGKKIISQRTLLLFLVPAIIAVIIFCYIPMFGLLMAFQNYRVRDGFFGSEFVGLQNFAKFMKDPAFFSALRNTLGISFFSILIGFPAPIILALMLDNIRNVKFKRTVQTITYLPHFISWVIVASLVYRMLDADTGVVNRLIAALGGKPIEFLMEARYFWGLLVVTDVWKEIGWNSIIYLAAISGIDPTYYDAAKVDGAGRLQQIWHITLPSIAPTIALLFVLRIGSVLKVSFDAVYNLMNPMVIARADVIDTYVFRMGIRMGQYSYATAIGFVQSILSIILVFIGFRLAKKINNYSIF
jgi:putative aldouronate transport system permease protein